MRFLFCSMSCIEVYCLTSKYLRIFQLSFHYRFLVQFHCGLIIYFVLFLSFKFYADLFYMLAYISCCRIFHMYLRRMHILLLLGGLLCSCVHVYVCVCMPTQSLQSCLILCNPIDSSLLVSSVHWIFPERILE